MEFDRIGAGTEAHSSCASRAVRQASTKVFASPKETSAITSFAWAGLRECIRPPGASSMAFPPAMEEMVRVVFARVLGPVARTAYLLDGVLGPVFILHQNRGLPALWFARMLNLDYASGPTETARRSCKVGRLP